MITFTDFLCGPNYCGYKKRTEKRLNAVKSAGRSECVTGFRLERRKEELHSQSPPRSSGIFPTPPQTAGDSREEAGRKQATGRIATN